MPVGKIDDGEEDDDADADGEDVGDAGRAERDQKGERGFGSVGGGTEGVEAENRDACGGSDALIAVRIGAQGRAEEEIKHGHSTMIVN